ncbi:HAMP domain-containing histidine kinase [Pseudomonas aeruginosa]|nr:HAMP domain-containing sensor histidine kinase [Pseudomonas aeruginosa]MDA3256950.1 HAMP domain-containing histidine kinase [Pseudomonas aeruginosa]MDA3257823.1 HAMP domain-containing histidine kinase [Pseudomonas aeruginosa]MDA3259888.1 HAMP domain-containing histidine kinase [Pseudomonas aeruginosa]MDA3260365.1 HAMP domain-containing histidine kinase [Pseudomonas aeruginosa]MDA3261045.1 HAMP domain-containing histidine kinase [Pseudomonas aeruginosa]
MLLRNSLRGRLVAAYVLLAVIIGSVFAVSSYVVVEQIEDVLIDKRLARAAKLWAQASYGPVQPETFDLSFLKGDQLPSSLRRLSLGTHELRMNDRGLHVLIGEVDGERYAVVDDQSDFESIESESYIALGIAFLGGLALAVLIGRASASRVILPLTHLAQAVQDGRRAEPLPGLDSADEIGVLAHAVEDRTNQLALALQRERWFTADVSHELRTPLTVMLGAAEVLSSRLQDRPELQPMIERIRRNAADTGQQVAALLQLARAPELSEFTRVELRPLIAHELERCQPLVRGKSLKLLLQASGEVSVQSMPELVAIAVGNLLRNACQHTEQGQISICLEPDRILIEDTGAGVPETVQARLFDRFVRGSDDFTSGSGLGLAIVKRVVDQLGWRVEYSPRLEGGSRFTLFFPAP